MAQPGKHIFISYARDDVAFARDLRERLLTLGQTPWMDLFDIPAGARWPSEIDRALRASDVIVGLMSPAAVSSENVMNEWDWAIANSRRLILLLIEPCQIPFHYVSRNYLDFTSDQAEAFDELSQALDTVPLPKEEGDRHSTQQGVDIDSLGTQSVERLQTDPLVGRDHELRELKAALTSASASSGQLRLLAGEPGIGKSRLSSELVDIARQQDIAVYVGHCYEWDGTPPYWPWIEILRARIANFDDTSLQQMLGTGAARIAQIVEEIDVRLPNLASSTGPELPPEQVRFQIFDAISRFLHRSAQETPIVLVIEDLHWADGASLQLLDFIARQLATARILVLGTYRDSDLTPDHGLTRLLPQIVRQLHAEIMALQPLSANALAEMMGRQEGARPAPQQVKDMLLQTGGNPLFAGEYMRLLASGGRSERVPAAPPTVLAIIQQRLDLLPAACRERLTEAAILGVEFALTELSAVADSSTSHVARALDPAIDRQLLQESPSSGRFSFRHALIQQALTDQLSPSQRMELHRAAADAIEKVHERALTGQLERLAYHYYQSAPLDDRAGQALDYIVRAGKQAMERLGWESALGHFSRALELMDEFHLLDEHDELDLLLRLYEAQMRTGDYVAGAATFERLEPMAEQADDIDLLARAALGFVGLDVDPHSFTARRRHLVERLLQELPAGDSELRVRAMAQLTAEIVDEPDSLKQRQELSQAAVAMAMRLQDATGLAFALIARFYAPPTLPPNAEVHWRLQQAEEILRAAGDAGNADLLGWGCVYRAMALLQLGRVSDAADEYVRFEGYAEQTQTEIDRIGVAFNQARIDYLLGDLTTGDAKLDEIEYDKIVRRSPEHRLIVAGTPLEPRRSQGNLKFLEPILRQRYEEYPDRLFVLADLAVILCDLGKLDEARTLFEEARASNFDDGSSTSSTSLHEAGLARFAEVAVALDDRSGAASIYDSLIPYSEWNLINGLAMAGPATYYLGMLAAMMEMWDEAGAHFEHAAAFATQMGAPLYLPRIQYAYAEMLGRRARPGDRYHGLELLERALAIARECGMTRLEQMIVELQDRLRAEG